MTPNSKPCSIGSVTRGTDRGRDRGEIPSSSESGSAVEKESHGRRCRVFQSRAERKESTLYAEDDLIKKIGRLEIENDFLRSVSISCGLNPEKLKSAIRIWL